MSHLRLHKLTQRISFLMLFCILLWGNIDSYAQTDIPFIYYYSREDSAFVVERADHTERQILATYPLSEAYFGQLTIDGPGWSSSGKLFTWMSRPSEGGGAYANNLFIVRSDGSSLQTIFTEIERGGIRSTAWSPTDDLLLILSVDATDVITPTIEVYDPVTQNYLFSYTSPIIPSYLDGVHWSPDGRYITVSGWNSVVLISVETSEIINLEAEFPTTFAALPKWLSGGNLAYTRSPNELVIRDIDTQEEQSIMVESHNIQMVDWSPSEAYVLLFTTSPELDNPQLYIFSRTDETTTLVADNLTFPNHIVESHWSTDSQYAYFISDMGELNIISVFGDVYTVQPSSEGKIRVDSQIEWASGSQLLFMMYGAATHQFELYQYDVTTSELHNLSEEIFSTSQPIYNFSVQDNLLFLGGLLVNLESQEIIELTPSDELLIDPTRTDEFLWHSSGQWIFLLSMFNSLYHVKVASVEGVVSSEIALCPLDSLSCFGWLPNND